MKRTRADLDEETTEYESTDLSDEEQVDALTDSDDDERDRGDARPRRRACDVQMLRLSGAPKFVRFPHSHEWERSPEMRERKNRHQAALDARLDGQREAHIYATVLNGRDVHIEPNLFPYECDEGITHWTLWSRRDLAHDEIVRFVSHWCIRHAPDVVEFDYDENPCVSFCVPHVHVFFRRRAGAGAPHAAATKDHVRKRPRRWDVAPTPTPVH